MSKNTGNSVTVQKSSKRAKEIEHTHGFNQAQKSRDDRDKRAATAVDQAPTPADNEE